AVGSRDGARAEAYAREHGIERAHGSYEAVLADDGVDAVYIALPNRLHHEWTMRALAAGKHVLCEKPYTRFPAEVDEAWNEAGRLAAVLRFGDVPATFHCGFTSDHQSLEATGSEGVLAVPRPFTHPTGQLLLNGEEVRVDAPDPYRQELENFCAAIRGEAEPL